MKKMFVMLTTFLVLANFLFANASINNQSAVRADPVSFEKAVAGEHQMIANDKTAVQYLSKIKKGTIITIVGLDSNAIRNKISIVYGIVRTSVLGVDTLQSEMVRYAPNKRAVSLVVQRDYDYIRIEVTKTPNLVLFSPAWWWDNALPITVLIIAILLTILLPFHGYMESVLDWTVCALIVFAFIAFLFVVLSIIDLPYEDFPQSVGYYAKFKVIVICIGACGVFALQGALLRAKIRNAQTMVGI